MNTILIVLLVFQGSILLFITLPGLYSSNLQNYDISLNELVLLSKLILFNIYLFQSLYLIRK